MNSTDIPPLTHADVALIRTVCCLNCRGSGYLEEEDAANLKSVCVCAFGADPMPFYDVCYRIWMFCCNMWEKKMGKKKYFKKSIKKTIHEEK